MAKLNGEEVLVIESDKGNKITYVELPNGNKKWVNDYELASDKKEKPEVADTKSKKDK